jgi:lysophospholipase L1-like esterase
VVILAGTNDIAQNSGPESMKLIEDDLRSMTDLALANHIVPILCSVLPASDYPWRKGLQPGPKIVELNQWIENYCREQHLVFLNYYPAMLGDNLGMRKELSGDGVHPNSAGFAVMAPMAEAAIKQALP